jgi:Bacterial Ig-like domain
MLSAAKDRSEPPYVGCYALSEFVSRVSLAFACCLAISLPAPAADASTYLLYWNSNSSSTIIEVSGLTESTLRQLQTVNWQSADWQKLLSVYAGQGDLLTDMSVPPMVGSYTVEAEVIRFTPKFPLERDVNYRAVFRPSRLPGSTPTGAADLVSKFKLPLTRHKPTTVVSQIYPSAEVLPENLLKFYVHFTAPMQGGHIYEHIHLRDDTGKAVELPFLEIDEELWNPEMTRLTLFIDPGRIKRGVKPLEEIGPALEEGKRYTLEIEAAWHDNAGLPLRESFRKTFRVGPQDREPPSPATWKIKSPKAGTREALTVNFSEPMDHALGLRVIHVANASGRLVAGASALSDYEQRWTFTPHEAWAVGRHQLQVQTTIEDLAGNNIGKAFEVDLFEGEQRRFTNTVVKLSFDVR